LADNIHDRLDFATRSRLQRLRFPLNDAVAGSQDLTDIGVQHAAPTPGTAYGPQVSGDFSRILPYDFEHGGTGLNQQAILLLIANGAEGSYGLDSIRLMKGAFLASQRGESGWGSLFDFRPYDYGPFDASVYRARDSLVARGYLRALKESRYERYELTDAGRERVAELEHEEGGPAVDWLRRVGGYVTSRSFAQLLREVYAAYPDYAERSVFTS
jgi:hypothetical protein